MPPKKEMRTEDTYLVGTDDQVQLLLETRDFKARELVNGWALFSKRRTDIDFSQEYFPSYSRNSYARQNKNKLLEVEYQV